MRVKESGIAKDMADMQIEDCTKQNPQDQQKGGQRKPGCNQRCQWKKAMRQRMMQAAMMGQMSPPFMHGSGPGMMCQMGGMGKPIHRGGPGRMHFGPPPCPPPMMMAPWMRTGPFGPPPHLFEMGHPKQMIKMWKIYLKTQQKMNKDIQKKKRKCKGKQQKSAEKDSEEGMMTEDSEDVMTHDPNTDEPCEEVKTSTDESQSEDENPLSQDDEDEDDMNMPGVPPFMMHPPWMFGPMHMGRGGHGHFRRGGRGCHGRGRHGCHGQWRKHWAKGEETATEEGQKECANDNSQSCSDKQDNGCGGKKQAGKQGQGCQRRRMRMFRQAMMMQGMPPPMWMDPRGAFGGPPEMYFGPGGATGHENLDTQEEHEQCHNECTEKSE